MTQIDPYRGNLESAFEKIKVLEQENVSLKQENDNLHSLLLPMGVEVTKADKSGNFKNKVKKLPTKKITGNRFETYVVGSALIIIFFTAWISIFYGIVDKRAEACDYIVCSNHKGLADFSSEYGTCECIDGFRKRVKVYGSGD